MVQGPGPTDTSLNWQNIFYLPSARNPSDLWKGCLLFFKRFSVPDCRSPPLRELSSGVKSIKLAVPPKPASSQIWRRPCLPPTLYWPPFADIFMMSCRHRSLPGMIKYLHYYLRLSKIKDGPLERGESRSKCLPTELQNGLN